MDLHDANIGLRRVAWILDAKDPVDLVVVSKALEGIKNLTDPRGCTLEPLRIASRGKLKQSPGDGAVNKNDPLLEAAHIFPPQFEVLPTRTFYWESLTDIQTCHYLSCYTQLNHTDLVIASDVLSRRVFQLFRISLLSPLSSQSRVPVLLVPAKLQKQPRFNNILFPVIDPAPGGRGLKNLLDLARLSGAHVTLLFQAFVSGKSGSPQIFGTIPFYEPVTMLETNAKLRILSEWMKRARESQVGVDLWVDQSSQIQDTITWIKNKGRQFDLVALDPERFDSELLNNHYTKLAKELDCPIWISHPMGQSTSEQVLSNLSSQIA